MPVDYETIYRERAADYHRLVSAEDAEGNLLPALERIAPLQGARVLEVGVGTGRITRQLVGRAAFVLGVEREPTMLDVARETITAPPDRLAWAVGDARELPAPSASFDVAIAGWVFGHFRHWLPDTWRDDIGRAIDEMDRALRPGGAIIIVETLGTGRETPAAPNPALAEYQAWLERERGFERSWIRTDYAFADRAVGEELCSFFFGPEMADKVRQQGAGRLPECTGVWSRRKSE